MNIITKRCSKCKCEKSIDQFGKHSSEKDGLRCWCKRCNCQAASKYASENIDKLKELRIKNRERTSRRHREYYKKNKEKLHEKERLYRKNNKEKLKAYRNKNKERRNIWEKEYKKLNPSYKLISTIKVRILVALKNNYKLSSSRNLLCCDIDTLKKHLEKMFTSSMAWDNHGLVWHIDHIIPCNFFDLTDLTEQKLCFHYGNLQPLLSGDNLTKGTSLRKENFKYEGMP